MGAIKAGTTADDAALIDVSVLDGLRAAFGDNIVMLLSRTRVVIAERVEQIAARAPDGGGQELGRLAHEVGGMAGQVGLARLSAAALRLEALSAEGDPAEIAGLADCVRNLARESLAALPAR